MNQEIKQRWISKLRSGEYKQGTKYLCKSDSYCCLGVLCEVYREDHPGIEWESKEGDIKKILDLTSVLSRPILVWAGLDDANPMTSIQDPSNLGKSLAELNDAHYWNFNQIADQIEKDF